MSDKVKLLVVTIDSKLMIHEHVKSICQKTNKKTKAFSRVVRDLKLKNANPEVEIVGGLESNCPPPPLPYDSENFYKSRIFCSGKLRKKSDSVSDTVSIYVKFCNKRPQANDMDSFTMDKKRLETGRSINFLELS